MIVYELDAVLFLSKKLVVIQFFSVDFNPILMQGVRGYPGIRARINQRAFQYASGMIADVLNQEIRRARLPPITQCIPQFNGCAQIYNLYVSRYRCPQRVVVYPAPPNKIVLQVQNLDVGVTGNLGGQIVILLPIPLTGIIQLNLYQGNFKNFDFVFQQQITNQVRQMIPGQICNQLPSIVNEKVNSRLAGLPQVIPLSQMIGMFGGALLGGLAGPTPSAQYVSFEEYHFAVYGRNASRYPENPFQCQTQCRGNQPIVAVVAPTSALIHQQNVAAGLAAAQQILRASYNGRQLVTRGIPQKIYQTNQARAPRRVDTPTRPVAYAATPSRNRAIPYSTGNGQKVMFAHATRAKRQVAQVLRVANGNLIPAGVANLNAVGGAGITPRAPLLPPPPPVPGAPPPMLVPPPVNLCANCPAGGGGRSDPMSILRQLLASLDMRRLNDLYLSLQILNTQATSNDFTIDLTGEFSPNAQGGTPFGPFPTMFPYYYSNRMAEFIVSDYTINSLLYWMHRKQFLSARIGPETPQIGELLKTTCGDDDEVEATKVELDEATRRHRVLKLLKTKLRTKRDVSIETGGKREKRQDVGGLADLGICLGDILPAVRERYPKQRIAINIRTARAPSVIFSAAQGGTVILDAVADADFYIDGTNIR
ncbi:LBP / BPI / CETP family protein, partial [Ancylostoma caninum]